MNFWPFGYELEDIPSYLPFFEFVGNYVIELNLEKMYDQKRNNNIVMKRIGGIKFLRKRKFN